MIKEALITTLVATGVGGSGYALKFWADNTYIRQDTYQRSIGQERIWSLQDRINNIRKQAAREDRQLTQFELNDIDELQQQIDNLKGW